MTATTTLPVLFATGVHGSRPAASAVGSGGLYSCTTHGLVYQTDGVSTWSTWATLGAAAPSGSITASGYTQSTARMLGRTTGSTGAIEEISVGTGLSLSAGSLTATGGAAGALIFLEAHTASSSATLDFTTFISSTYDTYRFEFVKIVPANNAEALWLRMGTGGGPTYDSTAGHYQWSDFLQVAAASASLGSTSAAQIALVSSGISNVSTRSGVSGWLELFDPQSASDEKLVTGQFVNRQTTNADAPATWTHGGLFQQTTAVTAVRFLMSTGNIASGTIRVYGVSKS